MRLAAVAFGITIPILISTGCERSPELPTLDQLNVLLIVIDTFGAEHAGAFQNPGLGHTPNLDRLASRGVVFRRAYSSAPWTQPSVARYS